MTTPETTKAKIRQKGVTKQHIAKMVGIDNATLSKALQQHKGYDCEGILKKVNEYLDKLNTDTL